MSRKWITALAVMAAAGGLAVAATAVVGKDNAGERPDIATLNVSVHRSGSAAASGIQAQASGKTKFTYLTSGFEAIDGAPLAVDVDFGKCPRKSKVVSGFVETDTPDSAISSTKPVGNRDWQIRLTHYQDDSDYQASFGLVCAKSKK